MKKKDLKTGMLVELRNGKRGIVLLNTSGGDIIGSDGDNNLKTWLSFSRFNEDLNCVYTEGVDIVKVYDLTSNRYSLSHKLEDSKLIWEREETIEYVEIIKSGTIGVEGRIYKVVKKCIDGYYLYHPESSYNIFKFFERCKPSTKEAYEAQFKANELTIEEIEKLTGLKNIKIKK